MSLIGLVILLIALLVGGPVMAQGGGIYETNCNGLSEADCQILKDSAQMTQSIHSFTIPAWAIDLSLEAGPESIMVEGSGSATVVLPEFLTAWASEMPAMTSPTDYAPVISLLQQIDVAFVERLLAETGLQLTIDNAALQAPGQTLSGGADVIFKDSSLYVRLDSPTGADAWFGEPVEMTDTDREDLMQSLEEMLTQLQSEEFQESLAQMSELTGAYDEIITLVNKYISTTRNADAELMGQTMYTFTTTFDVKGLLADPELPGIVLRLLQNPAMAALDMDTEDMENLNETQVQFVLMTANLLIK
ncbi:MAG: hypothetical protein HY866_05065, partial [Chloroflexi bacterium]|nr:hypothetical protein [Chloroflexota bacterium]